MGVAKLLSVACLRLVGTSRIGTIYHIFFFFFQSNATKSINKYSYYLFQTRVNQSHTKIDKYFFHFI